MSMSCKNNHRPPVALIITVFVAHVMHVIRTILFLTHSLWNTHVTSLRVSNLFLETLTHHHHHHFHTQTLLLNRLRQKPNSSNYSNSWYVRLTRSWSGDENMNNEMGWPGNVSRGPLWRYVTERAHLKDLGVDGRIILNGSLGNTIGRRGLDWTGSE